MSAAPGVAAAPFSAEEAFLLAACSVAPAAQRAARLGALAAAGLDPARLVPLALKNRVVPLVLRALRAHEGPGAAAALEGLRPHAQRSRTDALVHVGECLRLLDALAAAGVRAMPYKGPVLAATLYDDLGERQYHDLDVLVEPRGLERARAVALELGYEPRGEGEDRRHVEEDCELHYRHPARDLDLELHWEALPRRHRGGFALDELWGRLSSARLAGREVAAFAPEDLLLVLCVHGGEKHRWSRLQMLADVARLLARAPRLDWELALARADALARRATVLAGAGAAWLLLDAPLPARVAEACARSALVAQAAATAGRIARTDSGLDGLEAWRARAAELARRAREAGVPAAAPGLASYLGVVLRPEWTDRQALALPAPLGFLYWLYRPWRLLRRHGARLFGRL